MSEPTRTALDAVVMMIFTGAMLVMLGCWNIVNTDLYSRNEYVASQSIAFAVLLVGLFVLMLGRVR